jgi:hypothetical protein
LPSMETLSLVEQRMVQDGQDSASTIIKKRVFGFGILPFESRFGRDGLEEFIPIPGMEIDETDPILVSGGKAGFQTWGETERDGIEAQVRPYLDALGYSKPN